MAKTFSTNMVANLLSKLYKTITKAKAKDLPFALMMAHNSNEKYKKDFMINKNRKYPNSD